MNGVTIGDLISGAISPAHPVQTTNAIKDVASEGHISPGVMGILAQT